MIRVNGEEIVPKYFPDGTLLLKGIQDKGITIEWKFESNEELVAVTEPQVEKNLLTTVFKDGKLLKEWTLKDIRARLYKHNS